jgi:Domain of unknown function (DUF4279)
MHTYTVEFRVEGLKLDPLKITSELNLEPCQVRNFTDVKSIGTGRVRNNMWSYDGFSSSDVRLKDWDSLEAGLLHVLKSLSSKKELIANLAIHYKVYWWCGHFQSGFNGGPRFSPALLTQLADFGVELILENYFHEK